MGKLEKSIYAVIILVLVAVIASGTTYLIMRDKDNTNTENNEVNDKDKESNDNKDNEKEEITLSEKELNDYLSYVPDSTIDFGDNDVCNNQNVYCKIKISVSDLDKKVLVGKALFTFASGKDELETIATFEELASKVLEMYGVKIDNNFKSTYDAEDNFVGYAATYGGFAFNYNEKDKTFNYSLASSGYDSVSLFDSYQATNDELVIYSYYGVYNSLGGQDEVKDVYTNNVYHITEKNSEGYLDNDIVVKYMKNNKDKFTKYKHTFRKNEAGYYWYQTEVVKD